MLDAWESLVNSTNEQIYEQQLKNFTHICTCYSTFQEYVYYIWLLHHKEIFLQAWTGCVMHLWNTTTNRYNFLITCFTLCLLCLFYWHYTKLLYKVEDAHVRLKRLLCDRMRYLWTYWDVMKSINMVDHRFNTFYKRLWGFVSTQVQSLIFDELKRSTFASVDSFAWGCTLRTTHGLPLAYELARYNQISGSIP